MERKGRLAFVPARYGPGVVGGAELVLRDVASGLAARGWDVDVLTTCARDHFTWHNEFEPGVDVQDGVTVRRFPAVVSTARAERAALNAAIVAGAVPTLDEQHRWINDDMRAPDLFEFLLDESPRYRAVVFAPYLFWLAYACSEIDPGRSILMPCLHDEPEAHLEIFRSLFARVRGIWFLSDPERDLAARLFPGMGPHAVVGAGVDAPDRYDPDGFRRRHGVDGPFVVYAGRREAGKNWPALLGGFEAAIEGGSPFSLVTMGHGAVDVPPSLASRVVDLGYQPTAERDNAFAAADAALQPSAYESFSLTMMESWLAGTPIVANGASAVSRWHCDRSGGGLVYDDELEFGECLRFVADRPSSAAELGRRGREYVLEHYTWATVLDRMEATLEEWTAAP